MPDNTINWGQGAIENTIDWGKAKSNSTNGFGAVYDSSYLGDTNISGGSSFSNTKSIEFDGTDDHIVVPNISPRFDTGSATDESAVNAPWSVSLWAYIPSGLTGTVGLYNTPLGQTSYSWSMRYHLSYGIFCAARYRTITVRENGIANSAIIEDSWNHIVATFDGVDALASNSWGLYINGSQITNISNSGHGGSNTTGKIYIGRGYSLYMNGKIDEVAIWDSDISANVSNIYNNGTPTDLTSYSPLGWWRMGDNDTFPTITDNGSGGNNGTMTNMDSGDIVEDVPS